MSNIHAEAYRTIRATIESVPHNRYEYVDPEAGCLEDDTLRWWLELGDQVPIDNQIGWSATDDTVTLLCVGFVRSWDPEDQGRLQQDAFRVCHALDHVRRQTTHNGSTACGWIVERFAWQAPIDRMYIGYVTLRFRIEHNI
jgi:hypothetical protein